MDLFNLQRENIVNVGKLGKLSHNDLKRILSKLNIQNLHKNDCWIWNGTVSDKINKGHQHGIIWYNKKYVCVHRIMYHNYIEDVPEYTHNGLIVLHNCSHINNGRCINPWHMRLGSKKDNTLDAMKENTLNLLKSNEENHMSKLKNKEVLEIRELKNNGLSQKEIGKKYGINQSQVSRYLNNKTRII